MRLRIRHVTTYDYASPVAATTQLVRMTPRVDPGQRVLEWNVRLEVLPSPSRSLHQPPVSDEIWPSRAMSDPPTIPRNHRGMDEPHLGYASAPDLTANDDGYGNRTHLVAIVGPHVGTRLVATGVVETSGPAPRVPRPPTVTANVILAASDTPHARRAGSSAVRSRGSLWVVVHGRP
jgi:transglutaminase-like putative cysteine protease